MKAARLFPYRRDKTSVLVSRKFQVVIPKSIRESMGLKPGMMFEVLDFEDRIELVPVSSGETSVHPQGELGGNGKVCRPGPKPRKRA